jgi:uncharacterized zinc-type alcohol dehydrogenase-like protein
MLTVNAFATHDSTGAYTAATIERRDIRPDDVLIAVRWTGICHSDIHMGRSEWGPAAYPFVPGHEIAGEVEAVGSEVTRYSVGDRVGVGCLVDSCGECRHCLAGEEQFCAGGIGTYGVVGRDGQRTMGGYSTHIVVRERFVLRIPESLDLDIAAPMLCAGITTFSPLMHYGVKPTHRVAIAGLGGLGHMGVKFAHAMGARVVMITTSPQKGEDARRLGADEVLVSTDAQAMAAWTGKFDFLLNTIPVPHDFNAYMMLLKRDCTMCIVGAIGPVAALNSAPLIMGRRNVAGSLIGGIKETQEMLDFAGLHNIVSDVEVIDIATINEAYVRMQRSDVKYRFVIDLATLG